MGWHGCKEDSGDAICLELLKGSMSLQDHPCASPLSMIKGCRAKVDSLWWQWCRHLAVPGTGTDRDPQQVAPPVHALLRDAHQRKPWSSTLESLEVRPAAARGPPDHLPPQPCAWAGTVRPSRPALIQPENAPLFARLRETHRYLAWCCISRSSRPHRGAA